MRKFHYCVTNLFPLFDSLMKTGKLTEKVGQTVFNLSFVGQLNWNDLTPLYWSLQRASTKFFGVLDLYFFSIGYFLPPPPSPLLIDGFFSSTYGTNTFFLFFPSFLAMFIHDVRGSRCTLFSAWHQKRWWLHDGNFLMCQKEGEFLLFGPFASIPYSIQQK